MNSGGHHHDDGQDHRHRSSKCYDSRAFKFNRYEDDDSRSHHHDQHGRNNLQSVAARPRKSQIQPPTSSRPHRRGEAESMKGTREGPRTPPRENKDSSGNKHQHQKSFRGKMRCYMGAASRVRVSGIMGPSPSRREDSRDDEHSNVRSVRFGDGIREEGSSSWDMSTSPEIKGSGPYRREERHYDNHENGKRVRFKDGSRKKGASSWDMSTARDARPDTPKRTPISDFRPPRSGSYSLGETTDTSNAPTLANGGSTETFSRSRRTPATPCVSNSNVRTHYVHELESPAKEEDRISPIRPRRLMAPTAPRSHIAIDSQGHDSIEATQSNHKTNADTISISSRCIQSQYDSSIATSNLTFWSSLSAKSAMAVIHAIGSEHLAQKAANAVLEAGKKHSYGSSVTPIDLQGLATRVSVVLLEAGGDHKVAAAVAVAIMSEDTKNTKKKSSRNYDCGDTDESSILLGKVISDTVGSGIVDSAASIKSFRSSSSSRIGHNRRHSHSNSIQDTWHNNDAKSPRSVPPIIVPSELTILRSKRYHLDKREAALEENASNIQAKIKTLDDAMESAIGMTQASKIQAKIKVLDDAMESAKGMTRMQTEMDSHVSQIDELHFKCKAMQNEIDCMRIRLSHVNELENRCSQLERSMKILVQDHNLDYSAHPILSSDCIELGSDNNTIMAMNSVLNNLKTQTFKLSRGGQLIVK